MLRLFFLLTYLYTLFRGSTHSLSLPPSLISLAFIPIPTKNIAPKALKCTHEIAAVEFIQSEISIRWIFRMAYAVFYANGEILQVI